MYIGALCMYIDCVFGRYIHVYLLCILVLYACILIVYMVLCICIWIVYMGAIYMYIDGAYGLYIHFYPAISTFAVQICYTNTFLLYSY
jgi:hypothetical protein